jgi:hypothetical protein
MPANLLETLSRLQRKREALSDAILALEEYQKITRNEKDAAGPGTQEALRHDLICISRRSSGLGCHPLRLAS